MYEKNDFLLRWHYSDVIMSAMASQITGLTIVDSTVCSGADQRKHQSSASLAFVRGTDRWFPAQRTRNADDVSIWWRHYDVACFVDYFTLFSRRLKASSNIIIHPSNGVTRSMTSGLYTKVKVSVLMTFVSSWAGVKRPGSWTKWQSICRGYFEINFPVRKCL